MTKKQIAFALKRAQAVAPETNGIMTDGHGNWFGHYDYHPTTSLAGPEGARRPTAFPENERRESCSNKRL